MNENEYKMVRALVHKIHAEVINMVCGTLGALEADAFLVIRVIRDDFGGSLFSVFDADEMQAYLNEVDTATPVAATSAVAPAPPAGNRVKTGCYL